MGESYAHIVI